MKKYLFALAALLVPIWAQAQSATFAGRASVGADYKIVKGLHLSAEEEIRSADSFSSLGSLRTSLGITYKPVKFLKLGAGYTLINPFKTNKEIENEDGTTSTYTGFWNPRHRFYGDITGYLRLGDFQFSLKERLQFTHNSDDNMNVYQSPRNALALKSRIGVKYKRFKWLEPSVYFEMRTALNDPWGYTSGSQQTKSDGTTYYAYTPTGYTHVYNNRYRGNISLDWSITKNHVLTPYVLLDFISEYELDTNKKGTRLFSAAYQELFRVSVGVGYVFKF